MHLLQIISNTFYPKQVSLTVFCTMRVCEFHDGHSPKIKPRQDIVMLRILIADDHEIVRKGLRQILLDEFPFAEIEEVVNGASLLERALREEWSVILSDISMPGISGIEALKEIRKKPGNTPVLILSMYPEDQYALSAIREGAAGYLTKDMAQEELVNAVRKVLTGKKYFSPNMTERLASHAQQQHRLPHEALSERELTVLKLLAAGKSISEIAAELELGITTISTYRSRILEKMRMKNNAELTRYALENRLA